MSELLNPYQRSALMLTLQSFEKSLRYARAWLEDRPGEAFQNAGLRPSRARCLPALDEIALALQQIAALREQFELVEQHEDPRTRIQAEMMVARASLWDSRSKKLTRFGKTTQELAQTLDPPLTRLADLANHLSMFFNSWNPGEERSGKG